MSPRSNAPNMVEIKISVPEKLLNDALELAAAEGWKPGELHRIFWATGFSAYAEGSNKRLVNRTLQKRRQDEEDEQD